MRITSVNYNDVNLINNGEFLIGPNSVAITNVDFTLRRKNTDELYVQNNNNHGRFIAANWLVGQLNIPSDIPWNFEWKLVGANSSIISGNTTTNPTGNVLYLYQPTKITLPAETIFSVNLATYPLSARDIAPFLGRELTLSFELAASAHTTPAPDADVQFSVALVYPNGEKSTVYPFVLKGRDVGATPQRITIPLVLPKDWFSNITNSKYAPTTHPGSGGRLIFLYGGNEFTETNINGTFNDASEAPKFRHKNDYPITEFRMLTLGKVRLGPTQANFVFNPRLREAVRLACLQRQQSWDSGYGVIAKNDYIPFYIGTVTIGSGGGYVGFKTAAYGACTPLNLNFKDVVFEVNRVEAQLSTNTIVFECYTRDTSQDLSAFPNTAATLKISIGDRFITHTHTLRESQITKSGSPASARIVTSVVNPAMAAFLNSNIGNLVEVKVERVETQYVDVLLPHHTPLTAPKQFIETFSNPADVNGSPYPYYMWIKPGATVNAGFPSPGKVIEQTDTHTTIRIPLLRNTRHYTNTQQDAKDIGTRLRIVRNAVANTTNNFLDDLTPEPLDHWFGCLMKPNNTTPITTALSWDYTNPQDSIDNSKTTGRLQVFNTFYQDSPTTNKYGFEITYFAPAELLSLEGPGEWTATRITFENGKTYILYGVVTVLALNPRIEHKWHPDGSSGAINYRLDVFRDVFNEIAKCQNRFCHFKLEPLGVVFDAVLTLTQKQGTTDYQFHTPEINGKVYPSGSTLTINEDLRFDFNNYGPIAKKSDNKLYFNNLFVASGCSEKVPNSYEIDITFLDYPGIVKPTFKDFVWGGSGPGYGASVTPSIMFLSWLNTFTAPLSIQVVIRSRGYPRKEDL